MPLRLIVGPPNSGRAGEVLRRLAERAAEEPVLVVPTGDDAAWFERELCAGGSPSLGVSIRTFGWLFEDVAAALDIDAGPALTQPQRLALIRAAIASTDLTRLRRSARRPGFAPALDALIEELQAALVSPRALAERAAELEDGAHEGELASLYRAYSELRDRSGRSDRGALAAAVLAAIPARPEAWGSPPVFLYGFDDLTAAQRELVAALSRSADVTVAVNYADRRSLAARATLFSELRDELGGTVERELAPAAAHSPHGSLVHLDRALFEPGAGTVPVDDGVKLLDCAGERGEAEAIGAEIAALLASGTSADDIAIVVRHPAVSGAVIAAVLAGYGIPVALEAQAPVDRTAVGRSLIALCRAAGRDGTAQDLLAHLRADPTVAAGVSDRVEERIRRGDATTVDDVFARWENPPRHLARLRAAKSPAGRLHALAGVAAHVAEGAHRERAPLAAAGDFGDAELLHPLELRAAVAAAELLSELAALGELPECPQPRLEDAIEALEGATVPTWRGPTDGRVRILSPYRLRAGRARYLFVAALGEGEFPSAAPPDPLLGDDRRRDLGIPALVRREQAEEERYLFHACVSRPTERLYLSWQSCNDEGTALARSPFVDEVLDLLGDDPDAAERSLVRSRGLEEVVHPPALAPSEHELCRALATRGAGADHSRTLDRIGVGGPVRERVLAAVERVSAYDFLPGPLAVPRVLEELAARTELSANQLELWLSCPYRWFVQHELQPEPLEPESDPLWLGSLAHSVLEQLYGEAPGADSIPRPGDLSRWRRRLDELIDDRIADLRLGPERVALVARLRAQLRRFLADEAASETALRPRPDLIEVAFGMEEGKVAALDLGEFTLRGKIDRIDVAPDGRGALVRDYKTGSSVIPVAKFGEKGSLQVQLYMIVAAERLGLDVIGGLYQPLGATGKRSPRGLIRDGEPRLDGIGVVRTDRRDDEEFDELLAAAKDEAVRLGAEVRAGAIRRDPVGGSCPPYCTFQPICRLERALGPSGESNGNGEE